MKYGSTRSTRRPAPSSSCDHVALGEEAQVGAVEDARVVARPALHEQVGEDDHVGHVGQGDDHDAARPQAREGAGQHRLGLGEVLEHVAGEDGVEELVAELRRARSARSHSHDGVEAGARLRRGARVELDADHLAGAGALEQGAVVPAAAAQVEHAQARAGR